MRKHAKVFSANAVRELGLVNRPWHSLLGATPAESDRFQTEQAQKMTAAQEQEIPGTKLSVRVQRGGPELVEQIAGEWRRLCDESGDEEVFYRPEWAQAYLQAFEPKAEVIIISAWAGEQVARHSAAGSPSDLNVRIAHCAARASGQRTFFARQPYRLSRRRRRSRAQGALAGRKKFAALGPDRRSRTLWKAAHWIAS